ncbi:hypothetical protein [Paenibacillus sp. PFR10]|uniref:hypothetical protein n=1 Tax=Paenibacillus TaxID=44249 RepID=UPI0028FC12E8|nr:hypothetical protein [Paenibacillus sp. PFR10]
MKKTIIFMCIVGIAVILASCKKDNTGPLNLNNSRNENSNVISETSFPNSVPNPATKEPAVPNKTGELPTPQPTFSITPSSSPTPEKLTKDLKSLIPTGWYYLEKSKDKPAIAEGDLNKDGIPDIAAVIEKTETTDVDSPRSLMIAFGTGNGNYTLSILADHVVLRGKEGGTFGDPFDDIIIDRGSIVLSDFGGSRWKWSDKYRFRFQNNDWYLIGLTKTSYDGATAATDEDDYNLLTGDFIQTKTDSGSTTPVITKGNRGPKTVLLREFKADISH